VEYPKNKTLHELFAEQVKRKPDNIALIANSIGAEEQPAAAKGQLRSRRYTLTYKELNSQAHRLALKLRFKGVKPETIVGIIVDPSVEMMVGLLAILKAGGAYLPIDPDLPPDRIDFMLKDSGTAIIVTNRDDLIRQLHRTVETQNFVLNGEPAQTSTLPTFYSPENLAYIIYTSGTTGKPKGVMVEHGNVVAYLHAFFCEFAITENHTAIQIASYAFDVFIEEVFPVLLRGGKIFIPHAVEIMDIELLSRLIYEQHVDILDCTPLLLNEFNNPNIIIKFLKYIRIIISGGDVLKWSYIDKLMEVGQVYNTYGPTESTVCATYYKLNGGKDEWEHRSLPIGKPVSNYKVYISDKKGRPVPIGFNGELCVAGPGITRGYLNRPELTAEKFTAVGEGSGRLYKTGDLARWLPDGSIEFSGRVDNQVKLRGFRIELGEIENCLRSHKKIEEAILMIRDDSKGDKFLCAYIVPRKVGFVKWSGNHPPLSGIVPAPPTIEAQSLREFLSAGLPYYMVPSHFVFIDEIPLNRNGKIDRKKLLEPKFDTSAEFIPPRTPVEKMMANIYSELLRIDVEKIGINDNFFELGGNSLNLIKLTTKIREVFGSNIPLTQILRDATVKQTANLILGSKLKSGEDDIMFLLNRINPENVFCFPPAVAHGLVYMGFAGLLQDYSVYAFNFINNKKLIELYVDNIIRVQPNGPYVLFAYSAGGKFALKTANLLEKKGYKVSAVILMECYIEIEKAKSADFEQKAIEYFENFKTILLDLGGDSLVEEVTVRVKDYQVFFNDLKRFDAINAPIYYISAENSREKKECLGWENLTRSEYKVYDGFGEHERMLEFVYIEKNVEIVKKILGHTK
jgi:amino acid adenylation domain-containing protein